MTTGRKLDALTGIRFFAAAHIILFHFAFDFAATSVPFINRLIRGGYVSTALFYVLSGFILTVSHGADAFVTAESRRSFWFARFIRLYPAYALGLALWLPFAIVKQTSPVHGVTAALGVQAWLPPYATAWNYPSWSTSVTGFFYAAFPFIMPRIARLDATRAWRLLGIAWGAALLPPVLYLLAGRGPGDPASADVPLAFIKYLPIIRLPEFVFGIGLGQLWRLGRLQAPRWLPAVAATLLVLVLTLSHRIPYVLVHNGLLTPVVGALIVGLATTREPLGQLLRWKPLLVLGNASFAMYALHVPVLYLASHLAAVLHVTSPWLTGEAPLSAVAMVVAVSIPTYYWFESPARTWLRRVLWPSSVRAAPPAVAERSPGLGSS